MVAPSRTAHTERQLESFLSLIREAVERATPPFGEHGPRRLIIRSISAKQLPRRPKGA
jgi:hypothetical protein